MNGEEPKPSYSFDQLPVQFGSNKNRKNKFLTKSRDRKYIDQIVEADFSKKFHFTGDQRNYRLPKPETLFKHPKWKINELQDLKEELNLVKSKLNTYNLGEWHAHTRQNNHAGNVMAALRKFQPEFLTQAWCKFYEVVSSYKLVPDSSINKGYLNSVHLCEAPGAFIASLNHYLKSNHLDTKWNWIATTLNPYYEGNSLHDMVNDDRFIISTIDNWWFGDDHTGNIYSKGYLEQLRKEINRMTPVLLITADGSIDCLDDPAEQESRVASLHYSETICALNILDEGGSFLLKMFTMFENETICLMYLLRCAFREVNVFKPVTSKEGNSEVYVICLGYKGRTEISQHLTVLNKYYYETDCDKSLFSLDDIPNRFIEEVSRCAFKFQRIQISVIERNISTYQKNGSKKTKFHLRSIRECIAKSFLNKYTIKPIEPKDFLMNNLQASKLCWNLCPRDESGSYLERQSSKNLDLTSSIEIYKEKLSQFSFHWSWPDIYWNSSADFSKEPEREPKLTITFGKIFQSIQSSKFCKGNLLNTFINLQNLFLKEGFKLESSSVDKLDCVEIEEIKETIKYLDVTSDCWIESYEENEKKFMKKLLVISNSLQENETLVICGLPLLTQLNVGLIFIASHFFQKIGFMNPKKTTFCIVFKQLKDMKFSTCISKIAATVLEKNSELVISLVPIVQLCEKQFLEAIMTINQMSLQITSKCMLDVLIKHCEAQ